MRHYRSETFRPPIGLTKSGHPALSPVSSPNRADQEWTSRTLTGEGGGATATESSARACCPATHSALVNAADASFVSRSASFTRRWFSSRRWRRRSVVSRATVCRRRAYSRCTFTDGESVRRSVRRVGDGFIL